MLTPQEAEARVFQKASFGGYNTLQVDAFLDGLIEDYRTLYQENLSLKSKLKVLVDKVEEYRATEDAMRMTLHSAQKMADAMVKEGEAQKEAAIQQAVEEVKKKSEAVRAEMAEEEAAVLAQLEQAKTALADEETRLAAARASTTAYVGKLKELYTQELEYIGSLSSLTAEKAAQAAQPAAPTPDPAVTVPPEQQQEVAQDIEASMAKMFDTPAAPAAEQPQPDLGDTQVFDQIQFGKDYEIE
jgi:cell division initiation protein